MRLMPCGMLFQSYSHSCLRDINDIVSEFLALCDDVHIYGSDAIRVFLFVYVCYVLVLELVTEIIDFCLYVDDFIYVTCLPMPAKCNVHFCEGIVRQGHHVADIAVLLFCEIFL